MAEYDIDRQADYYNRSNAVVASMNTRSNLINNFPFNTGNRLHYLSTIQIASRNQWNALDLGLENVPDYVEDLLRHMDQGHGNEFGELRVSLLRRENNDTGLHDAFFIVYCIPHFHGIDGDIIHMTYRNGSNTHQRMLQFFDYSEYSFILELTEYQILEFLAHDDDAMNLLRNYFAYGFNSLQFDYDHPVMQLQFDFDPEENEEDQAEEYYRIPPPPVENNIDIQAVYLAELANHPDIIQEYNNIIPYWLENEERIQELIDMQNVRG